MLRIYSSVDCNVYALLLCMSTVYTLTHDNGPVYIPLQEYTCTYMYICLQFAKEYSTAHWGHLPPHVFAVAAMAYHDMIRENKDQCCVISGILPYVVCIDH